MTNQQKNFLLNKLKTAIKDSEKHVTRSEGLFRAYQDASPSEQGDRAHAEAALNLAKEVHKSLLNFLKEAESDRIKYIVTSELKFYFAKDNVAIPGVIVISHKSPLGQAILNKKAGDKFNLMGKENQILSIS